MSDARDIYQRWAHRTSGCSFQLLLAHTPFPTPTITYCSVDDVRRGRMHLCAWRSDFTPGTHDRQCEAEVPTTQAGFLARGRVRSIPTSVRWLPGSLYTLVNIGLPAFHAVSYLLVSCCCVVNCSTP